MCGHEWNTAVSHRVRGTRCPMCAKKNKFMQFDFSNMTHEDWNKHEEKHIVLPLLSDLGIPEENLLSTNSPDIHISLSCGKKVGVEVTHYRVTNNKEVIPTLHKVLDGYAEHLSKITPLQYQITVCFLGVDYPLDSHLKEHCEDIYREIDCFIPGHEKPLFSPKYVEDVLFWPSPNIPTHISEDVAIEYGPIDEQTLLSIIRKKEEKLERYKLDIEHNSELKEYWLVINFSIEEKTDLRTVTLPSNFQTSYDRVYLVDDFYRNRVK